MTDNYLECISILVSAINKSEYIPTHVLKWNEIDAFFNSHRIIPLLSSWVKEYRTIVPTHILENWRKRIYQSIYYVSNYYAVQDKVVSLFESANIPFLILKGTSSGRYYPDPRFRTYGDIDLYFRDEDVHRACTCVSQNDMSTLFWTYFYRTIYLKMCEFICNNNIASLALSRVK
jgi:hypothetical protein